MSAAEDKLSGENQAVPFAYIRARDKSHRHIWAVVAAPSSQHEAIREAVRNVQGRGDRVNLPSLISAFKGQITASGEGDVPSDVKEALQLLYGDAEAEQPPLDFGV